MNVQVSVNAGICGFVTNAKVASEDSQNVLFKVESQCEKIALLGENLAAKGPIDAYQEISPAANSVLMETVRETLKGCCAGCAVPVGLFKGMQVAAGLALPSDISISMTSS